MPKKCEIGSPSLCFSMAVADVFLKTILPRLCDADGRQIHSEGEVLLFFLS